MFGHADTHLRACRNHKCALVNQLIDVGTIDRAYCAVCTSKLKPLRSRRTYIEPAIPYEPPVSNITPTDNTKLLPSSKQTIPPTDNKVHEMSWDKEKSQWDCSCGLFFTVYLDKELHLDKNIPGRRRHFTHKKTEYGQTFWECWCGMCFDLASQASDHDQPMNGTPDPKPSGIAAYGTPHKPTTSTDWHCEESHVTGCPLPTASPKLHIPSNLYMSWKWLAMRFNTEWIAYLLGRYVAEGDDVGWWIEGMYFPHQSAQAAHVEAAPGEIKPGVIGDVHSHVRMGAFFSAEDKAHMNHDVHVVINANGDMETSIRAKLECSRFTRVKGSILFTADPETQTYAQTLSDLLKERKR